MFYSILNIFVVKTFSLVIYLDIVLYINLYYPYHVFWCFFLKLCNEDLVYRHILKKHMRTKHGINAQRFDDR